MRSRSSGLSEAPDVVAAGELAFVSDQVPLLAGRTIPSRLADIADPSVRETLEQLVAAAPRSEERPIVQAWTALANLRRALDAAALDTATLGHVWLRVRRPSTPAWAQELLARAFPAHPFAVTVSELSAIPQAPAANVSVSATCGGIEADR